MCRQVKKRGPGRFIELDARIDSISVMPDVTGLSLRDAYTWLRHLGINVSIEGTRCGLATVARPRKSDAIYGVDFAELTIT